MFFSIDFFLDVKYKIRYSEIAVVEYIWELSIPIQLSNCSLRQNTVPVTCTKCKLETTWLHGNIYRM